MKSPFWITLSVAALFALHHLALWAERRGWIYYKHRKASPGTARNSFVEMQSLLEPRVRHVVESQSESRPEQDDSGDPARADDQDPEAGQ